MYLPSHLTKHRKEEIIRKYGDVFKIDRNVSLQFYYRVNLVRDHDEKAKC